MPTYDQVRHRLGGCLPDVAFILEISEQIHTGISVLHDPMAVLNRFERLFEGLSATGRAGLAVDMLLAEQQLVGHIATLFSQSHILSDILISSPQYLFLMQADFFNRQERPAMHAELSGILSGAENSDLFEVVRRYRRRELLRIGMLELCGMLTMELVMEALSDLADLVVDTVCGLCGQLLQEVHGQAMAQVSDGDPEGSGEVVGYAVIAMGKMGGRELNFSSDIDLLFVYGSEGKTTGIEVGGAWSGAISNHEYFRKLSIMLVEKLEEKTGNGFCYRVDLRLRPDGKNGVIARSLHSYETYYSAWGETWERQALIKARPCGGDMAPGKALLETLEPFIFRKYMDIAAIKEIWRVKQMIDRSIAAKNTTYQHVKLGYGGIREIEFIVQCFQLVYAGKNKRLRSKRTVDTIIALFEQDFIDEADKNLLLDGYLFLRNVESKLQIFLETPVYVIPDDIKSLAALAFRLNYRGYDCSDQGEPICAVDIFIRDYEYYRTKIRAMFESVFAEDAEEKKIDVPVESRVINMGEAGEGDIASLLERCGIGDLVSGRKNLLMIARGRENEPPYTYIMKRLLENFLPLMLEEVRNSPDVDHSLSFFESFLASVESKESYVKFLLEHQPVIRLLATVFGSSEVISNIIILRPALFDSLLTAGLVDYQKDAGVMSSELSAGKDLTEGAMMHRVREFKKQEMIRIGVRDILGLSTLQEVQGELTLLADTLLGFAWACAVWLVDSCGVGGVGGTGNNKLHVAIFALGRQGGNEMNYGSDLDILLVCSRDEEMSRAVKVADIMISLLADITGDGYAYKVDTRLRPFGSAGILVPSVQRLRQYLSSSVETWERQAFTKLRFVAGDADTGVVVAEMVRSFVYSAALTAAEIGKIDYLRQRMSTELVKDGHKGRDIKLGRGGLVDIQFIAQVIQMRYGAIIPGLQKTSTGNVLKEMLELEDMFQARSIRLSRQKIETLIQAHIFMTSLEAKLRIWEDKPGDLFPEDPLLLGSLAKRMGFRLEKGISPAERLTGRLKDCQQAVIAIYDELMASAGWVE